jgi:hypothetical protein
MSTATDVARAILAHHEELEAGVSSRVDAVLTAARDGEPYEPAVAELNALLAADVCRMRERKKTSYTRWPLTVVCRCWSPGCYSSTRPAGTRNGVGKRSDLGRRRRRRASATRGLRRACPA